MRTVDEFAAAFQTALRARELSLIVAKVEAVGPKTFVTGLALLENRFQFQRHIELVRARERS